MIHIKYKIWFALKLEIEDYAGDVFDVCELIPTERCKRNLERSRILVKQQPNILTHLIEVNPNGPNEDKPVVAPNPTSAFKYQLIDKGGRMNQRTNIGDLDLKNYTLYLSNNADNKVGSNLYMHKNANTISNTDHVFKGMFDEVELGAIAVIDVFQNNIVTADYQLLDATGKCREPVFIIRFAKKP